jgi:calcineurin-like phosphoesterase family protein
MKWKNLAPSAAPDTETPAPDKTERDNMGSSRTVYYTADLHLGHANVIRFCDRPFGSVEEMDEALIENWNAVVRGNDDVYVLGDFFYRNAEPAEPTIRRLKGRKHLILGNHDKKWIRGVDLARLFVEVTNMLAYKLDGVKYTLCHYPMLSWDGRGRSGGYMIHGHSHNSPVQYIDDHLLNAGVDINGYRPVTFDELVQNNMEFRERNAKNAGSVGSLVQLLDDTEMP